MMPIRRKFVRKGSLPIRGGVAVTDHALIRWLERNYGLDLDAERRKIVEICAAGVGAHAKTVQANGLRFVIQNNTVITVTPAACSWDKQPRQEVQL